ncbi:hypothetical protein [Alicyclobacillus sp. ALC3]|uniref:hypothetical protein n=1 Tax=Alicyclobacillus sp. ALC3 TaxID=2796143 RepID=UPI002377F063|nr:hypothetical protein [Alicyclobacillus sp. ALC3]WDL98695.1 hypothetical protein JC200_08565 [Alicyclobacillus sp. ALC3]
MHGLLVSQIGHGVERGLLTLVLNPLWIIGCLLMVLERSRAARQERRFFGARVSHVWSPVIRSWLWGIVTGVAMSAVCIAAGVVVTPVEVGVVSALTIILGLIRFRFFSPLYGIGILVLAGVVMGWAGIGHNPGLPKWFAPLTQIHVVSWIALGAAASLAEAMLVFSHRHRRSSPAYVLGKRGRPVGAFLTQWSFFVPVLTLSPGTLPLPHFSFAAAWPFLTGGAVAAGWTLAGMPLFVGISSFSLTTLPTEGAAASARDSLFTGLLLVADAYAVYRLGLGYAIVGVLLLLFAKEWTLWRMRRREGVGEPIYAPVKHGVRVLATSPESIAEEMGLLSREVITHVNQVPVHSSYDLHFAFAQSPAYAKLQVEDDRGELRFVGKPVYSGSRNQLGLILVPDDTTTYHMYESTQTGLFQSLYARVLIREPAPGWADAESAPTLE